MVFFKKNRGNFLKKTKKTRFFSVFYSVFFLKNLIFGQKVGKIITSTTKIVSFVTILSCMFHLLSQYSSCICSIHHKISNFVFLFMGVV